MGDQIITNAMLHAQDADRIALLEGLLREAHAHVEWSVARGCPTDLSARIAAALAKGDAS